MAPDPLLTLSATPAAAPAAVTPAVSPAAAAYGHASREPSAASFAGNLQAVLAQAGQAAGQAAASPAAIPAVPAGTAATVPASTVPAAAVLPAGAPAAGAEVPVAAFPLPTPGPAAAAPDHAVAGKPRGAGSPAGPAPAKRAGAAPADAQPAGSRAPDPVILPPAAPQPPTSSASPVPVAVDGVTIAGSRSRAGPTAAVGDARSSDARLGDTRPGAGTAVPQADAGLVGAQVAATPTNASATPALGAAMTPPIEAAASGISMSAAAPAGPFEKPGWPDIAAAGAPGENSPGKNSAAQQIVPALLSLGTAGAGTQRLTLRLDPGELGRVEVRIDRPASGPAEIRIAAERPETLALLQHDRHQLDLALNQAGLPTDRQIEFQIAPRIEADANHTATGGSDMVGDAAAGRNGFGSGGHQGDSHRHGRADPAAAEASARAATWLRAGIDITA